MLDLSLQLLALDLQGAQLFHFALELGVGLAQISRLLAQRLELALQSAQPLHLTLQHIVRVPERIELKRIDQLHLAATILLVVLAHVLAARLGHGGRLLGKSRRWCNGLGFSRICIFDLFRVGI